MIKTHTAELNLIEATVAPRRFQLGVEMAKIPERSGTILTF